MPFGDLSPDKYRQLMEVFNACGTTRLMERLRTELRTPATCRTFRGVRGMLTGRESTICRMCQFEKRGDEQVRKTIYTCVMGEDSLCLHPHNSRTRTAIQCAWPRREIRSPTPGWSH